MAVGEGASGYEAQLLERIQEEAKQQQQLLHARSQALCQKVVGSLRDDMDDFMRKTPAHEFGKALPCLIERIFAAFDGKACGWARDEALKLLIAKLQAAECLSSNCFMPSSHIMVSSHFFAPT